MHFSQNWDECVNSHMPNWDKMTLWIFKWVMTLKNSINEQQLKYKERQHGQRLWAASETGRLA